MPFLSHTLPNGLQIIAETSPSARSTALGFFVRTGSRDETPEVSGVTHFLEHMIFKGTPRRTALEVNIDFDRIGADYNASTSEETTIFHAAVLPEYLPQAIDVLTDILRPSLRQEDFDTEKKVIIEEIGMYEDQPMSSAYDRARKIFFGPHPLGNSVLGTVESITALTREQMEDYFRRRYVAPNVTAVAAGNVDFPRLVGLIEAACGGWETGPVGRTEVRHAPGSGAFEVKKRAKTTQEYVLVLSAGPAADDPMRHAASVLSYVLGDDSGSRLYWELVDPGLVESADCGFHDYEGTGAFLTTFSCDPERTGENLAIVRAVLAGAQKDGITADELEQAKSKILSRVVRFGERPKGRMQALGMNWLYLGQYRSVDDELKAFDAVTLAQVREVLDRFPLDKVTTFALGPLETLETRN